MLRHITLVQQFEQQQNETWTLAFSQDGKQLVSSDGNALYLWQLHEGRGWEYERSFSFQNVTFYHFASQGIMPAPGESEAFVKLFSFDGREVAAFPCPPSRFWTITLDLRWLVSGKKGGALWLCDRLSHQSFSILLPFSSGRKGVITDWPDDPVGRFLFTPNGQQVVLWADSPEGSLHICSFDPEHQLIALQKTLPHGMLDGAISPDGKLLAAVVPNGQVFAYKEEVYVYNLESLRLLHVFPQMTDERYNLLAFSPDSQYLMSCKTDGLVDIFSLNTFDCIAHFAAHPGLSSHATDPTGGLAWSKTGYIATGGASVFEKDMKKTDYTIKIWRVEE